MPLFQYGEYTIDVGSTLISWITTPEGTPLAVHSIMIFPTKASMIRWPYAKMLFRIDNGVLAPIRIFDTFEDWNNGFEGCEDIKVYIKFGKMFAFALAWFALYHNTHTLDFSRMRCDKRNYQRLGSRLLQVLAERKLEQMKKHVMSFRVCSMRYRAIHTISSMWKTAMGRKQIMREP